MLRLAVLLLVLANGVYYAWGEGLLLAWGWGPPPESEPWRLQQQIKPDAVRVLPAGEVRAEAAPAGAAPAAPASASASASPSPSPSPSAPASSAVPSPAARASAAPPQNPATLPPIRKAP